MSTAQAPQAPGPITVEMLRQADALEARAEAMSSQAAKVDRVRDLHAQARALAAKLAAINDELRHEFEQAYPRQARELRTAARKLRAIVADINTTTTGEATP